MYPLILAASTSHALDLIFQGIYITHSVFNSEVTFLWASFAIMGAQYFYR